MYPTAITQDICMIITAAIGTRHLDDLEPTTVFSEVGFQVDEFLRQLGIGADETVASQNTVQDLTDFLDSRSDAVRGRVWELATEARLQRLMQGVWIELGQLPSSYSDLQLWWYELVKQLIWWIARGSDEAGLRLVRSGSVERAYQCLMSLGLLDVGALAQGSDQTANLMVNALKQCDYPHNSAEQVYIALLRIARRVVNDYDGKLYSLLRQSANRLADDMSQELVTCTGLDSELVRPVRMWLSNRTGLPICVWSPSTDEFIRKQDQFIRSFGDKDIGFVDIALTKAVDSLGLPIVDHSTSEFMDTVCRDCRIGEVLQLNCVRHFAEVDWQVQCPAFPTGVLQSPNL